jgi:transcriptional regulator with XRE-family HTH domain
MQGQGYAYVMPTQPTFGAVLKSKREAAGLSRAALGKLAGVSDSLIKYLEHDTRQTVSVGSAHWLVGVRVLGLTLDDFAGLQVGRTSLGKFDYFAVLRSSMRPIQL